MIEFDAEEHTYTLNGRVLPSVTQVLDPYTNLDLVPADRLEHARMRGIAVHHACYLAVLGILDESTLEPEIKPYVGQFYQWLSDTDFVPYLTEHRVWSQRYGYAGTFDLLGVVRPPGPECLVDIKATASIPKTVGPQTAAYLRALRADKQTDTRRYVLQLTPDNYRFELLERDDANDWRVFLAALTLHQWRQ